MTARIGALLALLMLFCTTGASCPKNRQVINDYAPVVLQPEATLEDVIRVVNANSSRIQQVQSEGATLKVNGLMTLSANYAFDRPRRFRLRAETGLTGPELDIGSNPDIYWMWVKQNHVAYWGRHDEFYQSAAREVLPVSPDWLIEALGVVELDPTGQHDGPFRVRPGQLEIRSTVSTPAGPLTRVTVLDDARGWVLEQHLYNGQNQPIASSIANGFEFDAASGASLPRLVQINLPSAELSLTIQSDGHLVNRLAADAGQLWSMPQFPGDPVVNLGRPAGMAQYPSPGTRAQPIPQRMASRPMPVARDAAIRRLPPYFDRMR